MSHWKFGLGISSVQHPVPIALDRLTFLEKPSSVNYITSTIWGIDTEKQIDLSLC